MKFTAAAAFGASLAGAAGAEGGAKIRKALQLGMLPEKLSNPDKFALAKKCGFEGVEASPMDDLKAAELLGQQARDAGTPIHSIVFGGWHAPFSSPDPKVIDEGLKGMEVALRSAKALGASAVLLVPAIVEENVGYGDAYKRSQEHIRTLLPLAQEMGVVIAVENVWNKFLLSPLEFARYVDEFESSWLKAYFDVGNNIQYGYSQDWIRTLGNRLAKIHLKDFKRDGNLWTNLGEGDVNWSETRKALDEIGYDGYATTELGGGNETYLTKLSNRIDELLSLK
jgi:hexulose-6-phosphate isomerase